MPANPPRLVWFGALGTTMTTWAADRILEEVMGATQQGHHLMPELVEGRWIGRCCHCFQASLIHTDAEPGQYGGIHNGWLSENPCGLSELMGKIGMEPSRASLMEIG